MHGASRGHAQESLALLKLNSLNYDKYQAIKPSIIQASLPESLLEQEIHTNVIEKDNIIKNLTIFWKSFGIAA